MNMETSLHFLGICVSNNVECEDGSQWLCLMWVVLCSYVPKWFVSAACSSLELACATEVKQ